MGGDELIKQIKRHEGLRLKPYRCTAGKLTIGYGRNLDDVGINEDEALGMLANDLINICLELAKCEHSEIIGQMSIERQAVIANMAYNIGVPALMKFKKMWEHIENCNYGMASAEMLDSKWAKQVGDQPDSEANKYGGRAWELAKQMREGKWQD